MATWKDELSSIRKVRNTFELQWLLKEGIFSILLGHRTKKRNKSSPLLENQQEPNRGEPLWNENYGTLREKILKSYFPTDRCTCSFGAHFKSFHFLFRFPLSFCSRFRVYQAQIRTRREFWKERARNSRVRFTVCISFWFQLDSDSKLSARMHPVHDAKFVRNSKWLPGRAGRSSILFIF